MASGQTTPRHADVIVIGCGPVGAMAAILLGQRGLSVIVVERDREVYPLPRAAVYDGEIARIFQNCDLQTRFLDHVEAMKGAGFRGGEGQPLGPDLVFPEGYAGSQGHPENFVFHQPLLEGGMRARALELGITLLLGHVASAPQQNDEGVRVTATPVDGGSPMVIEGRWLIAADGASSPVRKHLGIAWESLGYDRDWIVMDVILDDPKADLPPLAVQVCDPKRIHTYVPMCGVRRRWEFIINPGEDPKAMMREASLWGLLGRYLKPTQARIERAAAYQFHASIAERLAEGRIFLVGDAAHQTPPFLGQGMCTGIRDALNIAWKLDHVNRGVMPARMLSTYDSERRPHAMDTVDHAVAVGKLMDAFADAQLTSNWPTDLSALYGGSRNRAQLAAGVFAHPTGRDCDRETGKPVPQPLLHTPQGPQPMDAVTGTGFRVVSRDDVAGGLPPDLMARLAAAGVTFVVLPASRLASAQLDELLSRTTTIVVRPDNYVFGVADADRPAPALLAQLATHFNP